MSGGGISHAHKASLLGAVLTRCCGDAFGRFDKPLDFNCDGHEQVSSPRENGSDDV